jgi:hypothetical protein
VIFHKITIIILVVVVVFIPLIILLLIMYFLTGIDFPLALAWIIFGLSEEIYKYFVILSVIVLIFAMYLVVRVSIRLVVRRIMFSVGVMLFFLARGISVWHAWGTGG